MVTSAYIDSVMPYVKGNVVEVYFGDLYEQVNYTDNNKNVHSSFIGKVVGGGGDLLILSSAYYDVGVGSFIFGNHVYLNAYSIKALTIIDGTGTIKDAIHSANDAAWYSPGGKFFGLPDK